MRLVLVNMKHPIVNAKVMLLTKIIIKKKRALKCYFGRWVVDLTGVNTLLISFITILITLSPMGLNLV